MYDCNTAHGVHLHLSLDCSVAIDAAEVMVVPTNQLTPATASAAVCQVFGLMNLIIERLGQETIAPHVGGILPLLPRIWQAAADQSLLRIQVGCACTYAA
jgi:hypothetical protein